MLNETLTAPRRIFQERIERVNLMFDGHVSEENVFEECVFEGGGRTSGGNYGVFVHHAHTPLTRFINCTFRGYDKAAVSQFSAFYGCTFEENGDAIFAQEMGYLHIEGNTFRRVGGLPGDHADAIQCASGERIRIIKNTFDLSDDPNGGYYTNSCIFIESKLGPVDRISITQNDLKGGNYLIYVWKDEHQTGEWGAPGNVFIAHNKGADYRFGPVAWNLGSRPEMVRNQWQEVED